MLLSQIKKEFDYRHDFESDDLDLLNNRFPTICFLNIPVDWICLIDNLLTNISSLDRIKEVRQEFGQLIIINNYSLTETDRNLIEYYSKKITNSDMDLKL